MMNRRLLVVLVATIGCVGMGQREAWAAQEPPAITGTIALEGTVEKVYSAANTVVVKAEDNVEHLFHFTRRTLVHGVRNSGDVLEGLAIDSRVVVHYAAESGEKTAVEVDRIGDNGLKTIEATVTHVDREGKRLSIRLADGSTETLELSARAASDVGRDVGHATSSGERVLVYYTDDAGRRTVHYFKRVI